MKICWDNLEGVFLSKNGTFYKGRNALYETNCMECKELCLVLKGGKFCSVSCSLKGKNHPNWKGGFRTNNPVAYYKNYNKKWLQNNLDKHCTIKVKRRATKLNQTPDNADQKVIGWFYTMAQQMSNRIGIIGFYHVDHIKPLSKGGLHHENNLQILTAHQNLQKGASY